MQIDADQSLCPACGGGLDFFPVFHHMMCAYVGPEYDFTPSSRRLQLPEMPRPIVSGDDACEIVGTSARCSRCNKEMVVSPPSKARL